MGAFDIWRLGFDLGRQSWCHAPPQRALLSVQLVILSCKQRANVDYQNK